LAPSRIPKMLIREPKARSPSHGLNLPLAHAHRRGRLLQLICLQTAAEILGLRRRKHHIDMPFDGSPGATLARFT